MPICRAFVQASAAELELEPLTFLPTTHQFANDLADEAKCAPPD